jgi:hypothetical protein
LTGFPANFECWRASWGVFRPFEVVSRQRIRESLFQSKDEPEESEG